MIMRISILIFFIIIFASYCYAEGDPESKASGLKRPRQTKDGWQTASLSRAGIDSAKLHIMVKKIHDGAYKNLHSILLIKNGKLVFEQYFPGYRFNYEAQNLRGEFTRFDSNTLHNLASVTKSITSVIFGIAMDQGWIKDVDEKVFDFLPQYAALKDSSNSQISLIHLLTMTSGLQWNENDITYEDVKNDIIQLFIVPDPVHYILSKPVVNRPGSTFDYNGGNTNLLGEVIQKTTQLKIDAFAKKHLFEPLGIKQYRWVHINDDMVYTSGDLKLRPRDMAKIGYLILNEGVWQSKRIVSSDWLAKSTRQSVRLNANLGYGYHWWLKDYALGNASIHSIAAMGWGGQNIIALPGLDAVVVVTAGNYANPQPNDEIIYRYILPALAENFKYDFEKIRKEAPIAESFSIVKPDESIDRAVAKFSGHWFGRGDFSIADQLIVEKIDSINASILYSWGDHPQGYFRHGSMRTVAAIDDDGRLTFSAGNATLTFEFDEYEDVLVGYYRQGDATSKLILNRL